MELGGFHARAPLNAQLVQGIAMGAGVQFTGPAANHLRQERGHALLAHRFLGEARRGEEGHGQRPRAGHGLGQKNQAVGQAVLEDIAHGGDCSDGEAGGLKSKIPSPIPARRDEPTPKSQ